MLGICLAYHTVRNSRFLSTKYLSSKKKPCLNPAPKTLNCLEPALHNDFERLVDQDRVMLRQTEPGPPGFQASGAYV